MSYLSFDSTHMDDKLDRPPYSLHSVGTDIDSVYYSPQKVAHSANRISRRSIVLPNDWSANEPVGTHRSATVSQFGPHPPILPPTFHGAPIPLYATGNPPYFPGYSAPSGAEPLTSVHDLRTVAMLGYHLTEHAHYRDFIDAPAYHCGPSTTSAHNNYIMKHLHPTQSSVVAMPIFTTFRGAGVSSHLDPVFPLDPTLQWSTCNLTTAFLPPFDSTADLSPSGSLYSSGPLSMSNHSQVLSSSDMLAHTQPQPITSTYFDPLYTHTVPLAAVEFPHISNARGDVPFFQCCWEECGIWITSDKDAVRFHLTHTHDVILNGNPGDSVCCKWDGCTSSLKRIGLVRHFQTHLGLQWLCSVCKGAYTRPDSVKLHSRRARRCQQAVAISQQSAAAYSARMNGDNTVTLTKILQP